MSGDAALQDLCARVREAAARGEALCIRGGGSKEFLGERPAGTPLPTSSLRGIVAYEPSELVVSVRAGTPLAELEAELAAGNQHLAFDPPAFPGATIGGAVAAGLSGPARLRDGAVRDAVLGATLVNGTGEALRFGGRVMKNVAGFDVSRLLAGSLGVLGLIAEVSLKVVPRPAARAHLRFARSQDESIHEVNRLLGRPLPVRASAWHGGVLTIELAGARAAVQEACRSLGGEELSEDEGAAHWHSLRDQTHAFFAGAREAVARDGGRSVLWRLALPATTPALFPGETQLVEWGGGQRWLLTDLPLEDVRAAAVAAGGHATAFLRADPDPCAGRVFTPLAPAIEAIHRRLKLAFDPAHVFNRGRMYPWL